VAFFVYILASRPNGTLYTGMTDDLVNRVWQHRNEMTPGFTQRYGVKTLVWYEPHAFRESAFMRAADQEVGSSLEACIDRTRQPAMARFVDGDCNRLRAVRFSPLTPAKAGVQGSSTLTR
jgi:predicted GIY-YIG superfamily endonuclease